MPIVYPPELVAISPPHDVAGITYPLQGNFLDAGKFYTVEITGTAPWSFVEMDPNNLGALVTLTLTNPPAPLPGVQYYLLYRVQWPNAFGSPMVVPLVVYQGALKLTPQGNQLSFRWQNNLPVQVKCRYYWTWTNLNGQVLVNAGAFATLPYTPSVVDVVPPNLAAPADGFGAANIYAFEGVNTTHHGS